MKEHEIIIHDYREAIRSCYGDKIADKSYFAYRRGWYYFERARYLYDGSCGVISSISGPDAFRKKEIIARTKELLWRSIGEKESLK